MTDWVIILPFENRFEYKYKRLFQKYGFKYFANYEMIALPFIKGREEQIKRKLFTIDNHIKSYKRKKAIFSFVISDKQFANISTNISKKLSRGAWSNYRLKDGSYLFFTYNQLHGTQSIALTGSQASGQFGLNKRGERVERFYY